MPASPVSIARNGRIATIRVDLGEGKNALSRQVMRDLTAAARSFEDDTETSAIVLAGAADVFTLGFVLMLGTSRGFRASPSSSRCRPGLSSYTISRWRVRTSLLP
jgi:enoyl-CoA hydratase/carnithine racemase